MTKIITNPSFITQLREQIQYPSAGVFSKVLLKDNACQYTLFCLAANTDISEHTSIWNATINVIEGRGILSLSGEDIQLEHGIFVFMPANAPHALKAEENLTFLLTLSEKFTDKN
ncbi:MAG: cupin domain-containing protein [Nostoc sp. DedQUE12b]|uniref:cupin domain-containing protein n=1 Tax=Nostoc sp. DedQUE12b TaxID=3075398 RepID=UPI002AD33D55|nr:cupin domain-containing protein [Nostoc sp. DedQUE12b]MDZ8087662.1 cupin domain-containing protein [Nostoc sp. DedQUE12b]